MTVTTHSQVNGDDGAGGAGTVTSMTEAQILAAATAGELTAGTWYLASDTGIMYLATTASIASPVDANAHLGTIGLAEALAPPAPVAGMTADINNIIPSGATVRIRNLDGTAAGWRALAPARVRLRAAGIDSTSPQYTAALRFGPPAGTLALFSALNLGVKLEISDETNTITSWRFKVGPTGDATDTSLIASAGGTPLAAGENQRAYRVEFQIESATTFKQDNLSNAAAIGFSGTASTNVADAAIALGAGTTASLLYMGLDYTKGFSDAASTTGTMIYTLIP